MSDVSLAQLSRIRTAATWLRSTSRTIDDYPKRHLLDERQRLEAQQFAAGVLPWPHRWTIRLYQLATRG